MTDEDITWKYPNSITLYSDFFKTVIVKGGKSEIGQMHRYNVMYSWAVLKDKGVNFTFIAQNFKNWTMDELMTWGKTTYKVLSLADF